MSIQSEISRISNNVNNSLDALAEQGVTVPADANSNDLPELIRSSGNQFQDALNGKADLSEGVFFIKGASGTAGTWTGTHPDITAYYDGLMIAYKIGVAGASTTTLNINGLGAVKVVRNATTAVSTVYPVNSVVFLVYTVDSGTAYWKAHDYDANTYQRVYETSTDKEYAITTRYNTTDGSTYYAEYGRYTNGVTINPSTNTITASKFKGALVGNADTATKATQDGNGKVIADTYATKTDIDDLKAELGIGDGYTNWIKKSVSTLGGSEIYGADYNGDGTPDGYLKNTRINSSGVVVSQSGMCLTGIIPVTYGDTVRIKNVTLEGGATPYLGRYSSSGVASVSAISVLGSPDEEGVYTYVVGNNAVAIRLSCGVIDETSIITINEEITGSENGGGSSGNLGNSDGVPDAVISGAETTVNTALSRGDGKVLRFIGFSDAHQDNTNTLITKGNKELGMAIGEIVNRIGVDFVSCFGDSAWGSSANTPDDVKAQIIQLNQFINPYIKGEQRLFLEGNHDDGNYYSATDKMTKAQIYSLLYAKNKDVVYDVEHWEDGYCYKDFDHLKVRVICLNTEHGTGDGGQMEGYQLKWFAEKALDMSGKRDWSVITIAHHMFDYGWTSLVIDAVNIVNAFANGSNLSNYTTQDKTAINIDYAGKNCEYIAHFHGHAHAYSVVPMQKYVSSTDRPNIVANGRYLWEICIPNACYTRSNQYLVETSYVNRYSTPTTYDKSDKDGKRTSFNLITIDLDNKVIYADNYGAGINRNVNYGLSVESYTITRTLNGCTSSSAATQAYDGSSHTETLTANVGYTMEGGSIKVTMGGTEITSTAYSNGVITIGNVTGNIVITANAYLIPVINYTNLVETAEAINSTAVYNDGLGYKNNYRLSSSSPFESGGATGYTMTGYMPFNVSNKDPIYIKGAQWVSGDGNCRMYFFTDKNTLKGINISASNTADNQNNINHMFVVETLGDNYIKLSRNTKNGMDAFEYYGGSTIKYFRISLKGSGENLIISLGDPIE